VKSAPSGSRGGISKIQRLIIARSFLKESGKRKKNAKIFNRLHKSMGTLFPSMRYLTDTGEEAKTGESFYHNKENTHYKGK
jgi:hypothetical protein